METDEINSRSFVCDEDIATCDDVPLIHNHQLKQHNEAAQDVVEVVLAVMFVVEF